MVLYTNFEEFHKQAKELFLAKPNTTRYTIKHRPGDQRITFKVTDDTVTYNFWTESQTTAKEFQKMNTMMMVLMSLPEVNDIAAAEALQNIQAPKTHQEKKKNTSNKKGQKD